MVAPAHRIGGGGGGGEGRGEGGGGGGWGEKENMSGGAIGKGKVVS